jgi:hypothetical protein
MKPKPNCLKVSVLRMTKNTVINPSNNKEVKAPPVTMRRKILSALL